MTTITYMCSVSVCLAHLCRYWWLKLKALAEKEEWDELEKFSKTKKSPIGYLVRTKLPLVLTVFLILSVVLEE